MDANLVKQLKSVCPQRGVGLGRPVNLDQGTPNIVDKVFYSQLLAKKGILQLDQRLATDRATSQRTRTLAGPTSPFTKDFVAAIIKLGNVKVLEGTKGEIRKFCSRINWSSSAVSNLTVRLVHSVAVQLCNRTCDFDFWNRVRIVIPVCSVMLVCEDIKIWTRLINYEGDSYQIKRGWWHEVQRCMCVLVSSWTKISDVSANGWMQKLGYLSKYDIPSQNKDVYYCFFLPYSSHITNMGMKKRKLEDLNLRLCLCTILWMLSKWSTIKHFSRAILP